MLVAGCKPPAINPNQDWRSGKAWHVLCAIGTLLIRTWGMEKFGWDHNIQEQAIFGFLGTFGRNLGDVELNRLQLICRYTLSYCRSIYQPERVCLRATCGNLASIQRTIYGLWRPGRLKTICATGGIAVANIGEVVVVASLLLSLLAVAMICFCRIIAICLH